MELMCRVDMRVWWGWDGVKEDEKIPIILKVIKIEDQFN